MSKENEVISSHIFIFPFKWDYIESNNKLNLKIEKRIDLKKFTECLDEDFWEGDEGTLAYNEYSYFYNNVRQAIKGRNKPVNEKNIVNCWKSKRIDSNSKYIIKILNGKQYSLTLRDIRLKVYDTGVANLVYFLENYDESSTEEDILKINDFGRRIYPQYLPSKNCKESFLAEKLELQLPAEDNGYYLITEDFNYEKKESIPRISKTIINILGKNFKGVNDEDTEEKKANGSIIIEPIIDDRMFVMCNYKNDNISQKLMDFNKYNCIKDEFWYKYVFVDNNDLTCQDDKMFNEFLKKSTYTRWKKYGTFYGVSRYSFMLLKKEDAPSYLNDHFNTLYYEMVLLALTQRASILRFSDETSKISTLDENKALPSVKSLQKLYIEFINSIYFREVTAQEQGIEMYDKIMDIMKIERDVKRLDDEIDEINKYSTQIVSGKTNNLLHVITYITISINVANLTRDLYLKYNNINGNIDAVKLTSLTTIPIISTIFLIFFINKLLSKYSINFIKKVFLGLILIVLVINMIM